MTEPSASTIGTVAQEAARLIEDMATMARTGYGRRDDPSPYAGEPAQAPSSPAAPHPDKSAPEDTTRHHRAEQDAERDHAERDHAEQEDTAAAEGSGSTDQQWADACSYCGCPPAEDTDDTPSTCRICPLCKGIALLRSVRPETVDLLADLANSLAASLRDVASRSRAADQGSAAKPAPGSPPDPGRSSVQDIPVDDDSEL